MMTSARTSASNLPNLITALRLVLVPVFLWLVLRENGDDAVSRLAATAVFLFASWTDLLDGRLARARQQITTFGIIADPIADKALTSGALIALSMLGELAWWITIVIVVREVSITLMRLAFVRRVVLPAGRGGKSKTAAQITAISLYLLPLPDALGVVALLAMALALVLTVATGVDYIRQMRTTLAQAA